MPQLSASKMKEVLGRLESQVLYGEAGESQRPTIFDLPASVCSKPLVGKARAHGGHLSSTCFSQASGLKAKVRTDSESREEIEQA